jgi:hypothetical protein
MLLLSERWCAGTLVRREIQKLAHRAPLLVGAAYGVEERIDETPVRVEMNGVVYRVTREVDPRVDYDPEAVRAAITAATGMLTPDESEALKASVYRAREEGSRPADRPCGIWSIPIG